MFRVRLSRIAAVAILFAVPLALANCSNILYSLINAPSYIGPYQRHANIRFGEEERLTLDVYTPGSSAGTARPVVVFWYGGMWLRGSKEQYRFVGAALANSGYVAVLPDYRLYPQARFPAFVEDGARAVKWAHDHVAEFGGDPNAIFLMGHSAGAHTAAVLALDPRYLREAGADVTWLKGWIGLSGPYALELRVPILKQMFREPASPSDWRVLDLVRGPSPPALLLHGTHDYLVYAQEAVDLDNALRTAGVHSECHIYEKASHVDVVAAFSLPLRVEAPSLADVIQFIDRTVAAEKALPPADSGIPCPAADASPEPGTNRTFRTDSYPLPVTAAHPAG